MSAVVVEKVSNEQDEPNTSILRRFFHKKSRSPQSQQIQFRIIGDYILGETLGMGGYSKVKLGVHKDTQKKVALKIMFGDEKGKISDSKKKQLKRELNVMKKVQHPNVIQLIDFHDDIDYPEANGKKKPCLITILEYAPGGELFDFLMFTGYFSEEATRTYLHQFINGLEAIHKVGIAHRDLKPENLLMDENFNLKIADFGFATEYKSEDGKEVLMTTSCGTKGYLAPELLKGKKYNQKCDLFAAGIILFTTYCGFPPFQNAVETDWWWDKLSKAWLLHESAKTTEDKAEKDLKLQKAKEKFDLFWKAHERSHKYTEDFKDLSVKMLHPNPQSRLDISDVRQHTWSQGKTYTSEEIKAYMDKRINEVMKERALKVKKQLEEQNVGPKSNYQGRSGNADANTIFETEIKKRAEVLDPKNEFNQYLEHIKDDTFINSYYRFLTFTKPGEIAVRIERIADKVQAKISCSPAQHLVMIRCAITVNVDEAPDDDVIIAVKQFVYDGIDLEDNDSSDDVKQNDNNSKNNNNNNLSVESANIDTNNNVNINVNVNKDEKIRYLVAFKRLQGSPISYRRAVEEFYNAREILEIMDTEDF